MSQTAIIVKSVAEGLDVAGLNVRWPTRGRIFGVVTTVWPHEGSVDLVISSHFCTVVVVVVVISPHSSHLFIILKVCATIAQDTEIGCGLSLHRQCEAPKKTWSLSCTQSLIYLPAQMFEYLTLVVHSHNDDSVLVCLCIHTGWSEGDSECPRQRSQTDGSAWTDQTEESLRQADHCIHALFLKCSSIKIHTMLQQPPVYCRQQLGHNFVFW